MTPELSLRLTASAASMADDIIRAGVGPVVLVAHSSGGRFIPSLETR